MIHVDMPEPTGPEWEKFRAAAAREREQAIQHFQQTPNLRFKFTAYSDERLKRILNDLFHKKCCYCESIVEVTHPIDIEHYRPKAAVYNLDFTTWPREIRWVKVSGHEGYYWLAGSWLNLLPSCIDCNRSRRHTSAGGQHNATGKANKFPVAGGRYGTQPGQEAAEVPLLLHPHYDNPEEHLEFHENGWVEGKTDKGIVSIEVYGLKRPDLITERARRLRPVRGRLESLRRKIVKLDRAQGDLERIEELELEIEMDSVELRDYLADDQPYLSMARQMVRDFVVRNLSPELVENQPLLSNALTLLGGAASAGGGGR